MLMHFNKILCWSCYTFNNNYMVVIIKRVARSRSKSITLCTLFTQLFIINVVSIPLSLSFIPKQRPLLVSFFHHHTHGIIPDGTYERIRTNLFFPHYSTNTINNCHGFLQIPLFCTHDTRFPLFLHQSL